MKKIVLSFVHNIGGVFLNLYTAFLHRLFLRKVTLSRWQWNVMAIIIFGAGMGFSLFILTEKVILPKIFAAETPWTQTDWSGGSSGGAVTGTVTTYGSQTDINTSANGQISIAPTSGWANDYLNWAKRKPITVTNSGSAQTNYQTRLSVSYDSDMQSDFDDLRFTNSSGTALDYWMQVFTTSTSATVWVEIDSLVGSGNTTIYMYYGNSEVSSGSNGENTFLFFDDFNDNSINTSKWTEVDNGNNEITETNGKLVFSRTTNDSWTKSVYSQTNFTRANLAFEFDYSWESSNTSYDAIMMGWKDSGSGHSYTDFIYAFYNPGANSSPNDSMYVYEDGNSRGGATGTWYSQLHAGGGEDYIVSVKLKSGGGASYDYSINGGTSFSTAYNSSYSTESPLKVGWPFYSGIHHFDNVRVRKWATSEPTASIGLESSKYPSSATLTSNIFNAEYAADWGTLSYTTSGSGTVTVKVRTDSSADMSGATDWSSCSGISSGSDMSANGCVTDTDQYLQYQITLEPSGGSSPVFEDISIGFAASDQVAPTTNSSSILMKTASAGSSVASGGWNRSATPYFSWTAGEDDPSGNGLRGYCIYLGTIEASNPITTSGLLTNSPVSTTGTTCGFIASGTSIDLSGGSYLSSALTSGETYYVYMKAVDLAGNIFSGSSAAFSFQHDVTAPTNVGYISAPSTVFGNVADMSFTWPSSGSNASSDSNSGVAGWQYSLDGGSTWIGPDTHGTLGITYIENDGSTYSHTLTEGDDGDDISVGTNTVYLRTVDTAGNFSSSSTYRTAPLEYGGSAPSFATSCAVTTGVTIAPSTSTSNSFALSWDAATATGGNTVSNYYYMINTSPPSSLSTLTSNAATYFDNSAIRTVSATTLPNVNKGNNTVYVVAVDSADNYSPSNCIKGTFTLNSTAPTTPTNLTVSDASVKSASLWRASLAWGAPTYTGTGTVTYKVQRSTDGTSWTDVTTTSGTAYVDTVSTSQAYYWRVGAYDNTGDSQASPSYTNGVTLTPKGTFTESASLSSGPIVSKVTTKRATITWSTSRASDSKVQYGTSSGSYFDEEPSKSDQTTSHEINLTNLTPGTKYYYKTKWTDEDGNTGTSSEKTFTTDPAPNASSVEAINESLSSATIQFTISNAVKATIQYGTTTAYGGTKSITTSTAESTHTVELTELEDGTKYHYRIVMEDSEGDEYESDDYHDLETLPRPQVSSIRIEEVKGTAQPTVLVTWESNTQVSSIVTYYPTSSPSEAKDEVNVTLKEGEHRMVIRGLVPQTRYTLIVKGRDKIGNEAQSDPQTFTTATDTRPPQIVNLKVEGTTIPSVASAGQETQAQLVVSWDTDEPSTSQVEIGEGSGTNYSQKTQEDTNRTTNHIVIISNLTPSKVYHLRAISKDTAGNEGKSLDTVTITPKATTSAFDLVVGNLSEVFGFLGGL